MLSTDEWKIKDSEQENCGLHNAIHVGIRENTTENMFWVETLGMPTDSVIEPTRAHIARNMQMIHDCLTVFVDDKTFEGHFNKFCRSVIWPALHYQMQAGPRHVDYTWDQYVKTNEAFADENIRRYRKGDNIWVSDYYLLLLPQILRSGLPRADIGFFLTTTFPSYEVSRCLFSCKDLLHGILGADLVSFQAEEYQEHIVQCCYRLLGLELVKSGLRVKHRHVSVWYEPLQIDSAYLQRVRQTSEVKACMNIIVKTYNGKRLIAARDRLDAPGGVKHKLLASYKLLKIYLQWRNNIDCSDPSHLCGA